MAYRTPLSCCSCPASYFSGATSSASRTRNACADVPSADEQSGSLGGCMLLWKLHTLDYRIASVRYRALLPIHALSRRGHRSFICKSFGVDQLQGVEVVIFVKSF